MDLILRNKDNNRYLAIECKLQETSKDKIKDSHNILREMAYIKLGMDFFKFM